jgi:hypothetical protein
MSCCHWDKNTATVMTLELPKGQNPWYPSYVTHSNDQRFQTIQQESNACNNPCG